jgi:membrane-associated phospholipid phosphatase
MLRELNARLVTFDERLSARLVLAGEPGPLRTAAILVTRSGDGLPFLLFLVALFLSGAPVWKIGALSLFVADVLTFLVVQTLKFIVQRARPTGEWGQIYRRLDPFSFPSGHSARGGAMAAMSLTVGPPWFGAAMLAWGVAVTSSRVLLGVHYVSDAIGGLLIGVAMSAALALLVLA